jgi:hypothetical protein
MAMNIFLLDHRGNRIKLLESADRAIAKTQALGCHFRVLLRASMAEVYVNDALLLPVPLPHTVGAPSSADPYGTSWAQGVRAPTVAAGLRGSWARAELRAWTMSLPPLFPMPPSDYPGAKTDDGDGFSQDCTFQLFKASDGVCLVRFRSSDIIGTTAADESPARLKTDDTTDTWRARDDLQQLTLAPAAQLDGQILRNKIRATLLTHSLPVEHNNHA